MRVHLAIVSEQLLPTVIPCLMDRPDRVVLVVSRAMAERARRLQAVLRDHGIGSEIRGEAPDARLEEIRNYARELADELEGGSAGGEVVFNATGGTKLMTLGFIEAFRDRAARIIYTDTAHAQIEVLYERGTTDPQPVPMADVLDVPRYLAVQGFRYQGDASRDAAWLARMTARQLAARYLAERAEPLAGLIGALNALARAALDAQGERLEKPCQKFSKKPHGRWWPEALRTLKRAGVIRWKGEAEVEFPDAECARVLSGGWLEEYAFAVVRDEGLHDVRINVEGVWEGAEAARNEFDVLACHRNRLLFIECKTLKIEGGGNDNELAYKVESLGKDTRGLFGDIWLLTARRPTAVLEARARQAGIRLVGPADLPELRDRVREWKQGGVVPEGG